MSTTSVWSPAGARRRRRGRSAAPPRCRRGCARRGRSARAARRGTSASSTASRTALVAIATTSLGAELLVEADVARRPRRRRPRSPRSRAGRRCRRRDRAGSRSSGARPRARARPRRRRPAAASSSCPCRRRQLSTRAHPTPRGSPGSATELARDQPVEDAVGEELAEREPGSWRRCRPGSGSSACRP